MSRGDEGSAEAEATRQAVLNNGSCVRLRPMRRNHVWSYDFVSVRTHDGRTARALNLIEALADVMVIKGVPEHLRSDNGPEFVAHDLRQWLTKTRAKMMYIEPGRRAAISCNDMNPEIVALH